jgi:hypothetical protein
MVLQFTGGTNPCESRPGKRPCPQARSINIYGHPRGRLEDGAMSVRSRLIFLVVVPFHTRSLSRPTLAHSKARVKSRARQGVEKARDAGSIPALLFLALRSNVLSLG